MQTNCSLIDEAIVSGIRMCSAHGPEVVLQSLKSSKVFYMVMGHQIFIQGDPMEQMVAMGAVYKVFTCPDPIHENMPAAFYIEQIADHPRDLTKASEYADPTAVFDMLPVFDEELGEA